MKILTNMLRELDYIKAVHMHWGSVVTRHSPSGAISGPYLLCYENAETPRKINGPGCGSCHTFLVDLSTGSRYNLNDTDKLVLVNTELRIMEKPHVAQT